MASKRRGTWKLVSQSERVTWVRLADQMSDAGYPLLGMELRTLAGAETLPAEGFKRAAHLVYLANGAAQTQG